MKTTIGLQIVYMVETACILRMGWDIIQVIMGDQVGILSLRLVGEHQGLQIQD